jgi:energy-coupling factor transport system ATP-binding protein
MELFQIENLTFAYPTAPEKPCLQGVNLTLEAGEYVALCGKSGSGKTTLLRHLKSVLTPHGTRSGRILFGGTELEKLDVREQAWRIGYVMQDPDSQIVTDKVWHELAFGLESLGVDQRTMRLRVAEMASYFGIQNWFHRNVAELSGGQKQLLNLASVMAMQPDVLILDEPTSQLDPIAAADFLNTIARLNRELGTTVLLSEHRLENVLPVCDRAAVMEGGQLTIIDTPRKVVAALHEKNSDLFAAMPAPARAFYAAGGEGDAPMTVREGRNWLNEKTFNCDLTDKAITEAPMPEPTEAPALEVKELWFRYDKDAPDVLRDVSLAVPKGSVFAILGGNGAGKSTLLKAICGICPPYRGKISLNGAVIKKLKNAELFRNNLALMPQDPKNLFVKKTVREELAEMLEGAPKAEQAEKIAAVAEKCDLTHLLDSHPYDLSGGEQQRAALGKVLLTNPKILLLDEPTKGLDCFFKAEFAALLRRFADEGGTVVLVSHDVEFCAQYADLVGLFFDGQLTTVNTPHRFFADNSFYTTAANRMSRHIFTGAVTAENIAELCRRNGL